MKEWRALQSIQEKEKTIEAKEVGGERVWEMKDRDEFIETMQFLKLQKIEVKLDIKLQRKSLTIQQIDDVLDRMGVTLNKQVFYKELGYDY